MRLVEVNLEQPIANDRDMKSALHNAVIKGNSFMVQNLIANGTDVNCVSASGVTPLHEACHYGHTDIVRLLLHAEAEIETQDNEGWTALHYAAKYKQHQCIKLLLKEGAKVDTQTKKGWTALHLAVKYAYDNVVCAEVLLINYANTTITNDQMRTPCYWIDHGGLNHKSKKFLKRNKLRKIFSNLPRNKAKRRSFF